MKVQPSIGLIVPTYNMNDYLEPLWRSLEAAGLLEILNEVIFVDDGSTDRTPTLLSRLASEHDKVVFITLQKNQGRFSARYEAAKKSRSDRLLFLDSRVTVPVGFAEALQRVALIYPNAVGCIDIDTTLNVYCLYWQRTHEFLFWRHYRDTQTPLVLTPRNYDQYLKGTGLFLCSRSLFLDACQTFSNNPPLSDDTALMRRMVEQEPLVVHPELRGNWVPRKTLRGFLGRLWERGPQFAEYHLFQRRGFFFWVVFSGMLTVIGLLWCSAQDLRAGLLLWAGLLVVIALSTVLISKSLREFCRLLPLHSAVVFTCGVSVLRGILYHWFRLLVSEGNTGPAPPRPSVDGGRT